jgi:hypothetical protein
MPNYSKFQLQPKLILLLLIITVSVKSYAQEVRKLSFDGTLCERKLTIKDLNPAMPTDWTGYTHLVMELRNSTPQRFSLWVYRANETPVRLMVMPFGQNVWRRICIPIQYFKGRDKSGMDLASANNRRTNSFWFSTWGPFGEVKSVDAIGFLMPFPVNKPVIELRNVHLTKQDEGSEFLEKTPVLDEFNQWVYVDWPGKIKSKEQLAKELADEEKTWGSFADFNYCELGGYKDTKGKATGFFHVEQIDGKWWFVDPHGHLYLSMGINGAGVGFSGRPGAQAATTVSPAVQRMSRRLESWGMTSGSQGKPYTIMLRWGSRGSGQTGQAQAQVQSQVQAPGPSYIGLPDVYSEAFANLVDQQANTQCTPGKDDPLIIGYYVGNEPAWDTRESEVVDLILAGPNSATQNKLKEFLAKGDTPALRKEFIIAAFEKYLDLICTAIKKYDPNHITLGIRFGGRTSDEVIRTGRIFDVSSINVYEYEPTMHLDNMYRLTGRPILIGEFHNGAPGNGLSAGLVQVKDQVERGVAYRYYVEQSASLDCFVGAHWFQWRDQSPLGRNDGENYNIGFVDINDRPYKELSEAAKATNKCLFEVHSGKILPFSQRPKASDAGTPSLIRKN